ncbi:putative FBD-associated F-box protein At5g22720 [Aegilops tauschii subsp. strangulata]|uniref:putative FBD-associated F-box protein At5g22720 n=1 Tax=Aegilops tauschii subsp. strangulata TaxID=200361 RepID=UPI00098AE876|nr:putative FBD-associated F-box protein At5g22720 [Aegilops tauschii subsp. strangulata]
MKLRSGRRLGSPAPPRSAGGADRISTLPDDLLLLVLAHLRCVRAAARASVLSRRWRDLWTRLPSLVFRDVVFPSVEPVLARVISSASSVSLLDICLRERPFSVRAAEPCVSVASLLRATAQLSPVQLILAIPVCVAMLYERVELPCFQRAKSISLSSSISLQPPATGELFPALTTLVLSGCSSDVGALVLRCPRLRVLRYTLPGGWRFGITVNSASLRELVVEDTEHWTFVCKIDLVAPMLEQLTLSSHVSPRISLSVLAPMAGNISWHCHYNVTLMGLGDWILETLSWLSTLLS